MASLVSMKRTAEEVLEEQKEYEKPMSEGNEYPYGLCLHLSEEVVKKLGVSLNAGDDVMITAKAHVKRVSVEEEEAGEGEGDFSSEASLQITDMAVEEAPASNSERAGRMYPSMNNETE